MELKESYESKKEIKNSGEEKKEWNKNETGFDLFVCVYLRLYLKCGEKKKKKNKGENISFERFTILSFYGKQTGLIKMLIYEFYNIYNSKNVLNII